MASVNKVILIGNLGKDPELRYTSGGQPVCHFSIATSEKWKNKNGDWEERTEWHNIVVWGKQAEYCKEYLAKGRTVYVEGRLQTSSWDDKDGNKKYKTEVVAITVRFLGSRKDSQGSSPGASYDSKPQAAMASGSASEGPPDFDADEDIPF